MLLRQFSKSKFKLKVKRNFLYRNHTTQSDIKMASINQINAFENKSTYEQYIYIKDAYISGNVEIGMELLARFKQLHGYVYTEVFTLYVLYGAFNEMLQQSIDRRVPYITIPTPEYSRNMITDMKNLGYPIERVIGDVSKHHSSDIPIPFRKQE